MRQVDGMCPVVQLFTHDGCTLCDAVAHTLQTLQHEHAHTLEAVDIQADANHVWHGMYKYDIPVLHINGHYWAKHRLAADAAREGLAQAEAGTFTSPTGQVRHRAYRSAAEAVCGCLPRQHGSLQEGLRLRR